MKDIYYAYFYPYLHSRDKILGPYIRNKRQKSYSSAKSLLESYYEEKPEGHFSSFQNYSNHALVMLL